MWRDWDSVKSNDRLQLFFWYTPYRGFQVATILYDLHKIWTITALQHTAGLTTLKLLLPNKTCSNHNGCKYTTPKRAEYIQVWEQNILHQLKESNIGHPRRNSTTDIQSTEVLWWHVECNMDIHTWWALSSTSPSDNRHLCPSIHSMPRVVFVFEGGPGETIKQGRKRKVCAMRCCCTAFNVLVIAYSFLPPPLVCSTMHCNFIGMCTALFVSDWQCMDSKPSVATCH